MVGTSLRCHILWVHQEPLTLNKVYQESSMVRRQPPRQLSCEAVKMLRVQWSAPQLEAVNKMMRLSQTMTSLKLT